MKNLIFSTISLCLFITSISAQNTFELSGVITTQYDEPLCGMMMTVTNTVDNSVIQYTVPDDGAYLIDWLEDGVEYEISLNKEDNSMNGSSTFDMVLLSKHILGVQELGSLNFYGADINGSGVVTVQDLVMLQLVILAVWEDYPGGENWHFFKEGETAPAETFSIMLVSDMSDYNFLGVKKGDLNGSANPCN